ncbi:nucleoside-diphosphate sugar epimerase/dehydratase [Paenibacillus sp.]|uniref:polysaccharide biosynthesis protein n=1 Tax=Paenibacillus sp. TaxID=58172 RepID=UPI002812889D|nr:nucleoside-diphosphate sugar epimerase/dehydratase [Paenibacillus sp.]
MTYRKRFSLLILIDSVIVLSAVFISRFLIDVGSNDVTAPLLVSSLTLMVSHHFFAYRYKLYKKAWEYASFGEMLIIVKSVSFSIATAALIQLLIVQDVYIRILAITWMLHMLFIGGSRLAWRIYRDARYPKVQNKNRTLIVGAGSAGTMVARQLLNNKDSELLPVAFIDDDANKHRLDIMGIPVIGGVSHIEATVQRMAIENIIIAIPSLGRKGINTIFQECVKTTAKTKILPMLEDLVTGKVSVSQFRDVQVEDLLGREPIELDIEGISEYVTDRVVLVTGAGGSIGSEICRQVAKFHPRTLVLLGHGENSIYAIEMALRETVPASSIQIVTEIADIQDAKKMMKVMQHYRPDVVYHAAAHKHVPLMERNPEEAIKNNILGTMNVAKAAGRYGVDTFVMISTDKAVNPTSVMGASKRLAEMIVQHMDTVGNTKFVAVRFGNVLGSRGSVIPLFKKQIERGGPVTVTHPDMVRYFMTIPEASRLVIQAGALAKGGEIFVLDMGEPVKIVDLAMNMIKLSGNSVEETGIEFTGIRPGEKLFEELLKKDEVLEQQVYPKIYVGKTSSLYIEEIEDLIAAYPSMEASEIRKALLDLANNKLAAKELLSIPS